MANTWAMANTTVVSKADFHNNGASTMVGVASTMVGGAVAGPHKLFGKPVHGQCV